MIDWSKANIEDFKLSKAICKRAQRLNPNMNFGDLQMDIIATHISGCKLKMMELLKADKFDFFHDVFGIMRTLDRTTGKLQNYFVPRYACKG